MHKQFLSSSTKRTLVWVVLFSIAMAFLESAVVVYLREIYYNDGFTFPLVAMKKELILVEIGREAATVVMLIAIGALAAKSFWLRFAYFMIAFGVWDIFYYVWLKIILNWPTTISDWDILFLIPFPWIAPVIAPVIISIVMIVCGILIIKLEASSRQFKSTATSWVLTLIGVACILFTFMRDTDAALRFQYPQEYWYWLFAIGVILSVAGFIHALMRSHAFR